MNEKKEEIEETEWFKPVDLSDEELGDVLSEEEIERLHQLAEQPEFENFDIAHARQSMRGWSE